MCVFWMHAYNMYILSLPPSEHFLYRIGCVVCGDKYIIVCEGTAFHS